MLVIKLAFDFLESVIFRCGGSELVFFVLVPSQEIRRRRGRTDGARIKPKHFFTE